MAVGAAVAEWRSTTSLQPEQEETRPQVQAWELEWEWLIEAWREAQGPDAVAQKT